MNKEIMITISKEYFDAVVGELEEFKNGKDGYVIVDNPHWSAWMKNGSPYIYTKDAVLKETIRKLEDAKARIKELTVDLYEQVRVMSKVELDTALGKHGIKKLILRYFPRK